jgi:hypothetical protein
VGQCISVSVIDWMYGCEPWLEQRSHIFICCCHLDLPWMLVMSSLLLALRCVLWGCSGTVHAVCMLDLLLWQYKSVKRQFPPLLSQGMEFQGQIRGQWHRCAVRIQQFEATMQDRKPILGGLVLWEVPCRV